MSSMPNFREGQPDRVQYRDSGNASQRDLQGAFQPRISTWRPQLSICSICIVLLASIGVATLFGQSEPARDFSPGQYPWKYRIHGLCHCLLCTWGIELRPHGDPEQFPDSRPEFSCRMGAYPLQSRGGGKRAKIEGRFEKYRAKPDHSDVGVAIVYTALGLKIPGPLQKGLDILAGMALPTALLLIGSTLSFGAMKSMVKELVAIGTLKLLALPLAGYFLLVVSKVPVPLVLPCVILLRLFPAAIII